MIGVDPFFSAIATKAGELAVKQIILESSRLSGVRDDLQWIEFQMGFIQAYLEDAEAIQVKTAVVSKFIREIWNLAYDVEDIIDTYFPQLISSWSRWMGLLGFRHGRIARAFAKEVEGIRKRFKDITKARKLFKAYARSSSLQVVTTPPRPKTFPDADEPNVFGIETIVDDLKQKVLNEDLSIIGMAVVGKTTLARKVYKSVRQLFDCAAWICVSERPNQQKLLRDIADQVGLAKEKMEQNFETNLFELLSTKRYVIVIDDIWRTTAWDALKTHLPTNSGRRIILTSGFENVGLYVGEETYLYKLEPLDPDTRSKLFYKTIADDSQNISEKEKIGKQILGICGGLPLAIILAAGLLRGRSVSAWNGVLEDIQGKGQDKNTWFDIFALSYKDLPLYLKPCFLYFGLFPEDCEIKAFDLISSWAADGFIKDSEVRGVEEVGYDYLNQLIARNLIQVNQMRINGRVRSVQIHDILHSLCILEANEINFFNIHTDAVNCHSTFKVRRVAIHGSDISHYLSLNPQTSHVRAMLCFHRETQWEERVTKNLLRDSKFLRLLRIENDRLPLSLLTEICNLRQLTYLKLRIQNGGLPDAISNLKSLLTLDLQESWKIYLPNVIWSMKQLRHILLPRSSAYPKYRQGSSEPVEFSLTNLQTLDWLPGNKFEADWLYKLTSLRTLRVENPILRSIPIPRSTESKSIIEVLSDRKPVSHNLEELWLYSLMLMETDSLNLSQYENLCNLHLEGIKVKEFPQHDKLPPNLTILTLIGTKIEKDPMETLKKLQKLKILRLMPYSYMGKELVCSGEHGDFPELEVLEIVCLPNIEILEVKEGGLPRLKDFKISENSFTQMPKTQIPDRLRNIIMKNTYQRESEVD